MTGFPTGTPPAARGRPTDHPALRLAQWPAADRAAWAQASAPASLIEDGGAAVAWRPASLRAVVGAYSRWLGYLAAQDALPEGGDPAARLTPERLRCYLAFLKDRRASVTVASYLGQLTMIVQAMFPAQDWRWLQAIQARQQRMAIPKRHKRSRIVPSSDLRQLGLDLMAAAEPELAAPETPPRQALAAARSYRDGLIIALLAARPLRVRNLLGIELGRQLTAEVNGYRLAFTAAETKNHRALDSDWPDSLVPHLVRYLERVRPLLAMSSAPHDPRYRPKPAGAYLWVAQGGTLLTPAGLYKAFGLHTRRRFGHALNPHFARDCAATTLAVKDPEHVRIAATILGHGSFRTTEKHYILANGRLALHGLHVRIAALRTMARRGRGQGKEPRR